MRYLRPTSLTWWAGVFALTVGSAALALPLITPVGEIARLVALLAGTGDASPAGLITLGLGLIGLRDRIERGFRSGTRRDD